MTSVQNSFYVDTEYGHNYYTFITEELPRFLRMTFPLLEKKKIISLVVYQWGDMVHL